MGPVEVSWIGQKRFMGVDSTQHSVVLSAGDDIGVKPPEAMLISLATCALYDVIEILHKQRLSLRALTVTASGAQDQTPPWAFTQIHLRFTAAAEGLGAEQLTRAIDLSLNKYCSVRASLRPEIAVTFEGVVEE
ncbi:MAG: OsmC family protein [Chloroflexales bacterium]|nr:OsmC family protein [Chloroflexales bacterium]